MRALPLLLSAALLSTGCYTATFEPEADALFACVVHTGDQPNSDCPGTMTCDGRLCVEDAPTAQIMNPEEFAEIPVASPDEGGSTGGETDGGSTGGSTGGDGSSTGTDGGSTGGETDGGSTGGGTDGDSNPDELKVSVTIQVGGFDFSNNDDDPDAGFLRVTFDGVPREIREAPSNLIQLDFDEPLTPGAHRIAVQVFRADGSPFGNAEASDRHVFWIDDGQPHVAITEPWPGTEFVSNTTDPVNVQAALLNFRYGIINDSQVENEGHVHVYYDETFPECGRDTNGCDKRYIGVISAAPEQSAAKPVELGAAVTLPTAGAGPGTLTAVLRRNNHALFTTDEDALVFDEIELQRTPAE